jgi:hypothetical protein
MNSIKTLTILTISLLGIGILLMYLFGKGGEINALSGIGYGAILLGGISFIGLVLALVIRSIKSPNK